MAEYGHLLPHQPDTRMATLDLMFVTASALPPAEGELVAALISEAWDALNAALPVLDAADAAAVAVAESDGGEGDDEAEPPSRCSDAPCPCGGRCGSVCEYEAAVGPQPLQPRRRSFRPRLLPPRRASPEPEPEPEAGPSRLQRKSSMRAASRDLRFWERPKFKAGPSGSQGLDALQAFLEREAAKAGKGKGREEVPRRRSTSSGSWDEAELAARGLVSEAEPEPAPEVEERRRWFRRR
jgi:hypothetical protein